MHAAASAAPSPVDGAPPPLPLLVRVLDGLAPARWDAYDSWLTLSMMCKHEGLALATWDAMSRRSDKYEEGACAAKWDGFTVRTRPLTQATAWK